MPSPDPMSDPMSDPMPMPASAPSRAPGHASRPATSGPPADDDALPALSLRAFCACLAVTLAIFVGLNPIWEPLDMAAMDANIGWSYAPIPLLVAAALAWERKLGWAPLAMESVKLTLVKFALTFLAANTVWAVTGPPRAPESAAAPAAAPAARAPGPPRGPPPATALDPATTGVLAGRVLDAGGAPVEGALVRVVEGLGDARFPVPTDPVELRDAGHGFGPELAVVRAWQPIVLVSEDGALHAAYAVDGDGRQVFNAPVLPDARHELVLEKPLDLLYLTCKVHGHDERVARLVVVAHPFATLTDADGRWRWEGVPAGRLLVQASAAAQGEARAEAALAPGGAVELVLRLP